MTSLILASLLSVQAPAVSLEETVRGALGAARLTEQSARFDPSILPFYRQGEFEMPVYQAAYGNPWRTPFLMSAPRRQLVVSGERPAETIGIVSRLIGDGASRDFLGNPISPTIEKTKDPASFTAALNRMKRLGLVAASVPSPQGVPEEVLRGAALIIESALDAETYRRAAFASVPDIAEAMRKEIEIPLLTDDAAAYQTRIDMARKVEMSYLYAGAQEIATAAAESRRIIGSVGRSADYRYEVDTVWGRISLTGRGVNEHGSRPIFVAIDTAGDDTWINPACNRSAANWVSVVVDTQGRDFYISDADLRNVRVADWGDRKRPVRQMGPGGAAFGVTALVDFEGDDVYRTATPGLGSATFGCSYLLDAEGNDEYDSRADSIGFGRFGIGIVEDLKGDDRYEGFSQVQGCGQVRGGGVLIDRDGSDTYTANNSQIDFPSAQSRENNLSLSQGTGVGARADYLNGRSLAGGLGILLDVAGDDRYNAGVFAQGTGYWMGVGCLWDLAGSDQYRAFWFGQGAAAHFSVGYLEDGAGSDTYLTQRFLGQGAGHDFGLGILIDTTGSDRYTAGAVSQGAASENGIGFFADLAGEDTYEPAGIALGYAAEAPPGSLRERALALGVFLDLSGQDDYRQSAAWARNGAQSVNWRTRQSLPEQSQLGVFVDK
jgi:hypothetical protein